MKIRLEKPAVWLINLFLCAFFSFGLLILIEQFGYRNWVWYSRSLCTWPILLCFITGTAGRKLGTVRNFLLPLSCLVAGIIMLFIFPSRSPADIVYIVFSMFVGAALFMIGLRGDEAFPSRIAIASIIIYIVALLYFTIHNYNPADYRPVTWCALIAFLLCLYSLNTSGLSSGIHNVKGGDLMALPSGIRGKNLLLLSLFIIIAVFIGNLGFLHSFLNGVSQWVVKGIVLFLKFISNLSSSDNSAPPTATPSPEPTQSALSSEGNGNPTFVVIYMSLVIILCIVFLILMILGFSKERRNGVSLGRLSNFLKRLFKVRQVLEYEDSVERTLDLKGIIKSRGNKLREFWSKLTYRPERFEDMPNNRMRVRFAYKMLLKSNRVKGWTPSATPVEVGAALRTESLRILTDSYNTARYDERADISDDIAEKAHKSLDDMKGRAK